LFKKFNENGTDTLKMSEVYNMFSYAGINIPEQEIENLFFRASSKQANNKAFQSQLRFKSAETMKHKFAPVDYDPFQNSMNIKKKKLSKQAPVNFEDFKAVMLSEEANERFKFLIKAMRNQIRKGKIENVTTDFKYLPTDLSMMMSHLF